MEKPTPSTSKRVIILEGPNGGGKTTIAKLLAERLKLRYVHHGPPATSDPAEEYIVAALKLLSENKGIVLDRFHLGELVYSEIRRGRAYDDRAKFDLLEMLLNKHRTVLIHLTADPTILHDRIKDQQKNRDLEFTQLCAEIAGFNEQYQRSLLSRITLKSDVMSVEKILLAIKGMLSYADEIDQSIVETDGVGCPHKPGVLFLADRRGDDRREQNIVLNSRCGYYLINTLKKVVNLRDVFIINSSQNKKTAFSSRMIGLINPKKIVILGDEAAARFKGLVAGKVPHPQFIMRFYHHRQDLYAQAILLALQGKTITPGWFKKVARS